MSQPTPTLSLAHLTRSPAGADATSGERPPLLVLLHGVGSNERDLFPLAPRFDRRFRVISVRAPLTRAPGSYAWFNVEFTPQGPIIAPEQLDVSRQHLIAFLGEATQAYDTDPARVYLFGFSQGAIMSLTVALSAPETVAGIIPIAGRIPPEAEPWFAAPERTTGLPVLLEHGRADTVLPIDWAHRARMTLERQRVALTYREYDAAHEIQSGMLDDALAWLDERLAAAPWAAPR